MANKAGYITLDSIVIDYLDASEQSNSKYIKIWNLAFRGMDNLGINSFYERHSEKMPLLPNKTVRIPENATKITKIGYLNDNGSVVVLKEDNSLTDFAANNPDRLNKIKGNDVDAVYNFNTPFFFNFFGGSFFSPLYGVNTARSLGSYKVDVKDNAILLDASYPLDYVLVEYIAAPSQDQTYYVPVVFREALIAWLAWKDNELVPKGRKLATSNGERKTNYFNERRIAIANFNPFDLNQAYIWNLENQRMTVKF